MLPGGIGRCAGPRVREVTLSASTFPSTHASGVPYGQLYESACKEQVSLAYAHAVATAARCSLEVVKVDHQTVDATVRQTAVHDLWDLVTLDIQMKCTSQKKIVKADHIAFPIDTKYYDQLRSTRRQGDIILVVMIVPPEIDKWVRQTETDLHLSHVAYWVSLRGMPDVSTESTTVRIPRTNVFDVEQLLRILSCIGRGGHL